MGDGPEIFNRSPITLKFGGRKIERESQEREIERERAEQVVFFARKLMLLFYTRKLLFYTHKLSFLRFVSFILYL